VERQKSLVIGREANDQGLSHPTAKRGAPRQFHENIGDDSRDFGLRLGPPIDPCGIAQLGELLSKWILSFTEVNSPNRFNRARAPGSLTTAGCMASMLPSGAMEICQPSLCNKF
jgi:hypothetical protein